MPTVTLKRYTPEQTVLGGPVEVQAPAANTPEPDDFMHALHDAKATSWDPHEVWLNRVKKPREDRSAR